MTVVGRGGGADTGRLGHLSSANERVQFGGEKKKAFKQPIGRLMGFKSPRSARVCVYVSASERISKRQEKNVEKNDCNVIKAECAGACACAHMKERAGESCGGADQSVQRGGGSYGFKTLQGHGACFSAIDVCVCVL